MFRLEKKKDGIYRCKTIFHDIAFLVGGMILLIFTGILSLFNIRIKKLDKWLGRW